MRELDGRADMLSLTLSAAWRGSVQSTTCSERGLLSFESMSSVVSNISSVLAAQALAFEAEDEAFEQSCAM